MWEKTFLLSTSLELWGVCLYSLNQTKSNWLFKYTIWTKYWVTPFNLLPEVYKIKHLAMQLAFTTLVKEWVVLKSSLVAEVSSYHRITINCELLYIEVKSLVKEICFPMLITATNSMRMMAVGTSGSNIPNCVCHCRQSKPTWYRSRLVVSPTWLSGEEESWTTRWVTWPASPGAWSELGQMMAQRRRGSTTWTLPQRSHIHVMRAILAQVNVRAAVELGFFGIVSNTVALAGFMLGLKGTTVVGGSSVWQPRLC